MKISYGVSNLRSLRKTPQIEIRPITILVGRNSAGKSTYLRSLPLLRQSTETRSSAPILWWGDLVDFGDFATAITDGNKEGEIVFSFSLEDFSSTYRDRMGASAGYYNPPRRLSVDNMNISYSVCAAANRTVPRRIELNIPTEDLRLEVQLSSKLGSDSGVKINGIDLSNWIKGYEAEYLGGSIFSHPILVSKAKEGSSGSRRIAYHQKICSDVLERLLNQGTPNNIGSDTIQREVRRLQGADRLDSSTLAEFSRLSQTVTFKKLYEKIRVQVDSELSRSIHSIHKLSRALSLLEVIEERLVEYFRSVSYVGPVRAASERFYRRQELEVSEISSSGNNFPMFLASLSPTRLSQFSTWVESIFGYGVELGSSGGHISINLKAGSRSVNVTDTGYGVSQILPVLGTIWWSSTRFQERNSRRGTQDPALLAIEQPELHLHPAHQAKLADVFASVVQKANDGVRRNSLSFMIETHSEALINRIGELVERGAISAEDVQIVIFSAEDGINAPTKVSLAQFDQGGVLKNWPFGFFNYD